MAANASVAVARLGGQATYWGRVGADDLGTRILRQLSRRGRRCLGGAADPRLRLAVRRHPGRRRRRATGLRLQRSRARPRRVVAAARSDSRLRRGAGRRALAGGRRRGPRCRQGAPAFRRCSTATSARADALLDLAARATHVVFSEPGLAHASGSGRAGRRPRPHRRHGRGHRRRDLGPDGFLWRDGTGSAGCPRREVAAVDTLAAGDVWHGAFTLALGEQRGHCRRRPVRERRGRDQVHARRGPAGRAEPRRGAAALLAHESYKLINKQ